MAAEPTPQAIALRSGAPDALTASLVDRRPLTGGAQLARDISRRMGIALPAINLFSAAMTYIFIAYVAPLPGNATVTGHRTTGLLATVIIVGVNWTICELLARNAFVPVRKWLESGLAPNEQQRARTLRMPLYEAGHVLVVWSLGGVGFGVLDITLGGSAAAGTLVAVMVLIGGLVASALCYFATEWIMRPAVACALEADAPVRPVLPGIAARIYLAWEFGTAVAVGGAVVVAVAYLSGAHISPRRMAATVIFLGAMALTIGLVTLLLALRSVADPIRALRRAMARVERGETDIAVPVDDGGEVGLLQAGFNRMIAGLRERDHVRDLFGRHVGEEVARSALRRGLDLGGEVRHAAVLFVDVIGSTRFAAQRDPREVVEILNRFFGTVVETVTQHGGWVNKFEGDAALCVFGAPTDHPDAAGAALAAARELRRRLSVELDGLDAAIGVSAGDVVAGNIGAAERYEYTVIGDPVNEAARLTELAKSTASRLLASEAVIDHSGRREAQRWALGEPVTLRGHSAPTRVAAPA